MTSLLYDIYQNETTLLTYWISLLSREQSYPLLEQTRWFNAFFCSSLVGLSGLFPVFLISLGNVSEGSLRFMLSFACGGLLGDVFLHLLPEAYEKIHMKQNFHEGNTYIGLWVLFGILAFTVIEMMCNSPQEDQPKGSIKISGYLNLVANCIDNFAHGLAVGGAFLVDDKTGFITTACILFHEIPHEIGDFAILMKSGFGVVEAARAQFTTAIIGVGGAILALSLNAGDEMDEYTAWILPFTSGGFLQIALVNVLPDLMKNAEQSKGVDTIRVLSGIALGISSMMAVSQM